MEEKVITMPVVNSRKFFRQYIELMQPMLSLRGREADVYAELLYFNYSKSYIEDENDRAALVFSIATRKKIQERLGISNAVIQQALGGLRRKGLIKGIKLSKGISIVPKEGVFSLTFKYVIDDSINA